MTKGRSRRIPPVGIPFNELGILRARKRSRPPIAVQRKKYRAVLEELAARDLRRRKT